MIYRCGWYILCQTWRKKIGEIEIEPQIVCDIEKKIGWFCEMYTADHIEFRPTLIATEISSCLPSVHCAPLLALINDMLTRNFTIQIVSDCSNFDMNMLILWFQSNIFDSEKMFLMRLWLWDKATLLAAIPIFYDCFLLNSSIHFTLPLVTCGTYTCE